jgi:hypothetical protein
MISTAAPVPTGRSMQIVVVARERRLDHVLLHLAVERERELPARRVEAQADERVLLGELPERGPQRAAVGRAARDDDGLERRRREVALGGGGRRCADRVADARVREAADLAMRPAGTEADRTGRAVLEDVDRRGAHAHVGDLLAGRAALDLEHRARDRRAWIAVGRRQELGDAGHQRLHARARARRSAEDRIDPGAAGLRRERPPQAGGRRRCVVIDVRGEQGVVVLGERLEQRAPARPVAGDDRGRQLLADARQHRVRPRAGAVGLVDEDQRRHAQAPQRVHQHARLRLNALDGRDDEHRAVEHAQDALDLRDEVGMPRRVDEVDRDVADPERHDRGSDRDAAAALERERVGLRRAVVDAAELVDDARGVEQALREGRLTGVDVGEDSEVERRHRASCPPW